MKTSLAYVPAAAPEERRAGFVSYLHEKLRRVTNGGVYLPQLDGLRFLAIAAVVLGHSAIYTISKAGEFSHESLNDTWLAHHIYNLVSGVELFFAISGFIIAFPFLKAYRAGERISIKTYLLRRVTRLEPPFVLAILLTFLLLGVSGKYPMGRLIPHLLATITYLHGIIYNAKSNITFITWSLEIEVQFYLFAPLLLSAARWRSNTLRCLLWVSIALASLAVRCLVMPEYPYLLWFLPGYLMFFAAGILAADLATQASLWERESDAKWDLLAISGLVAIFLFPLSQTFVRSLALFFGSFLLLTTAFRSLFFKRFLCNPWISSIGGMCYSIYLLHEPCVYACGKLSTLFLLHTTLTLNILIQLVAHLVMILVVCTLFYLFIEKPCMHRDWPARFFAWARGRQS